MYAALEIEQNLYALIMDCIPNCQDLDEYLKNKISQCVEETTKLLEQKARTDRQPSGVGQFSEKDWYPAHHKLLRIGLNTILSELAGILYTVSEAINHMHQTAQIFHFDIKPSNVLVDERGTPYITDLGFARDRTQYDDEEPVEVGFTWKYAHPTLRDTYSRGARITRTPAKARATVKCCDLTSVFDLYAFGRSIQELLRIFELSYGEGCHSIYIFNYIHLVACLLLDGNNSFARTQFSQTDAFVSDKALDYHIDFYKQHAIRDSKALLDVFRKLQGLYQIEAKIPELNTWHEQTLNASDLGPVIFSDRVARIVNHPAFRRLANERQLGALNQVFPTATHTRQNHSIGTYHAACQYALALYNDPVVPTFRLTATENDIKILLVTALIHDLGQSSFGHDLEEINAGIYSHTKLASRLLDDTELIDQEGLRLSDIIEEKEPLGWGLKVASVKRLLSRDILRPIEGVCEWQPKNDPLWQPKIDPPLG